MPKRARAALVAGVAAALILTPVSPAAAAILPCPTDHSCMYDYYDSPEMTNPVGRTDILCDGTRIDLGERTPWMTLHSVPC